MRRYAPIPVRSLRALAIAFGILVSAAIPQRALHAAIVIQGVVVDRATNRPSGGATVGIIETGQTAIADEKGRFRIALPRPGRYTLAAHSPGYEQTRLVITADPRKTYMVYLTQRVITTREIVVTAKKEKQNVSRRTLEREEIKKVPGGAGDLMRSIQTLPGVASAGDISGQLYVRGSGPYDNRILIDKFWLANAYHYGGFVSVINTDLIDSIDFYSGAFPAIFGEATGSVLELHTREKEEPTWGGKINVNLLTADAVLEMPLSENGYLILSGRRSYFDLYAEKFLSNMDQVRVTEMPVFWDYQAKAGYQFSKGNRIEFLSYGFEDQVGVHFKNTKEVDSYLQKRNLSYYVRSYGNGFTWKFAPSKRFHSVFKVGSAVESDHFFLGEYVDFDLRLNAIMLREDMGIAIADFYDINLGGEYVYANVDLKGRLPIATNTATNNPVFPDDFTITDFTIRNLYYSHWAGYLQNVFTVKPVKWTVGARYDAHRDVSEFAYVSPRSSLEVSVTDADRVSFATGLYQQAHDIYYTNRIFGNPSLTTAKAAHYVLSYHRDLAEKTTFSLETYYKKLWDLAVTGASDTLFSDRGTGYVYGGEILLQRKLTRGFFGWFSYGYSVSRRDDLDGKGEYAFQYDRTHIVNIIASYKLRDWFQAGIKWRYATGLPYTEITGSIYNPMKSEYLPEYSSDYNGRRYPDYQKLDIRFDFYTAWFGLRWNLYLEILNAYNHHNVLSQDFRRHTPYGDNNPRYNYDLPFLPYFGVEVRF